jgi:hypothetical protein
MLDVDHERSLGKQLGLVLNEPIAAHVALRQIVVPVQADEDHRPAALRLRDLCIELRKTEHRKRRALCSVEPASSLRVTKSSRRYQAAPHQRVSGSRTFWVSRLTFCGAHLPSRLFPRGGTVVVPGKRRGAVLVGKPGTFPGHRRREDNNAPPTAAPVPQVLVPQTDSMNQNPPQTSAPQSAGPTPRIASLTPPRAAVALQASCAVRLTDFPS